MMIESARFIEKAFNHCGEDIKILPNYSGRGMFGRETVAVSVSSAVKTLDCVCQYVKDCHSEINFEDMPIFSRLKQDNLGLSILLY